MINEKKNIFHGVIETPGDVRDYSYDIVCGTGEIKDDFPKQFELKPLTIKDQGSVSSCVGCAVATCLENMYGKEFSEGWNYGRLRDETSTYSGMIPNKALSKLIETGGLPRTYFDFCFEMPDIKDACEDLKEFEDVAKRYRIGSYVKLNNGAYNTGGTKDLQIKNALYNLEDYLLAISPYYFGESHAVVILGWDDDKDAYLIQNSWGEDWGDYGIGYVEKRYFGEVYQLFENEITLPFKDVKTTDWFYDGIKQCYLTGLMNGKSFDTFDPQSPITRAEAAVMFDRLMTKIDQSLERISKMISVKHEYDQL